jgi:hypothetical protein
VDTPAVKLVPVQPADPRARRRALLFLAVFLPVLAAVAFVADGLAVHVRDLAQRDRAAAAEDLWWMFAIGGPLLILPIAALAVTIFLNATRAHRASRFPPPGARTVFPVRVFEGRAARALARVHQGIAIALAGCAGALAWLLSLALRCLERSIAV